MVHDLRELLRVASGRRPDPTAAIIDSRTLQSTPESGRRAGDDGAKRKKGSKVHISVDTLGHLLTLRVTSADTQDRAQVRAITRDVRKATRTSVKLAFVDQGYTGEQPASDAKRHGIELSVVKLPEAKRGLVLLPRRWVVERSLPGWPGSDASPRPMNACPPPSPTSTSLSSPASCSATRPAEVHDML